jgi:hypothetical protein
MNKRIFAVIAGTILLQSAAFAADKDSDKKVSDNSACCEKSKKKAKKISLKKSENKQIATSTDQPIGAY